MAIAKATWWERTRAYVFGRRRIVAYCASCGRVIDNGQRLPRGTREVCFGQLPPGWLNESQVEPLCYGAEVMHS